MARKRQYYSIDQLKFGFGYSVREITEHKKRIAFLYAFIKSDDNYLKKTFRMWKEHNYYLNKKIRGY